MYFLQLAALPYHKSAEIIANVLLLFLKFAAIRLQFHKCCFIFKLTGYNVCNQCQVCKKSFSGYAELRDHVQVDTNSFLPKKPLDYLKRIKTQITI